jgi:hypothetical protein
MVPWYGPPIAVARIPGRVHAVKGGDFVGTIHGGRFACLADLLYERTARFMKRLERRTAGRLNAFADLNAMVAAAAAGKGREFPFQKVGTTGVVGVTNSLWGLGNQPAAGANAANAPGGTVPDDSTTGAFTFANPTGGDTQHFVGGYPIASVAGNTLLLYDRLFAVNKTMASTATEAVTGVPTRYQGTTAGVAGSAEGNFLFVEVGGTALAATAHNWTTVLYTNQAGTGSRTLPSLTGNSAAIVRRLDHPVQQWFAPLASGDTGIKELDQMQCSASVATGVINFVIGHPIAWMPCPIINLVTPAEGFSLARIFDDAALAFLEVSKPATGATTYTGTWKSLSG